MKNTRGNPVGEDWYDFVKRSVLRARHRKVTERRRQSAKQRQGKRV
jgi:hypothetical protein